MAVSRDGFQESVFARLVRRELFEARRLHPQPMNSLHEGWAVLWEEAEELWEEIRKKRSERNDRFILNELVQLAAMCQRMAEDRGLIKKEAPGATPA